MMTKIDKIEIEFIDHKDQRYPTCGDWQFTRRTTLTPSGSHIEDVLIIRVSKTEDMRSALAVAVHELSEAIMCDACGVRQDVVDKFDMEFESNRKPGDESEPGDSLEAPYFHQHNLATAIEQIVTSQMSLPWDEHESNINKLG